MRYRLSVELGATFTMTPEEIELFKENPKEGMLLLLENERIELHGGFYFPESEENEIHGLGAFEDTVWAIDGIKIKKEGEK